MSLTSLDGLLPSTLKKLLKGELPELTSAHISEGMAAGCGYRNNAAFLTDLKGSGPIRFVPVARVDAEAMALRLIDINATRSMTIGDEVRSALARIHAHVLGDIVPLGPKSSIVTQSVRSTAAAETKPAFGADAHHLQVLRDSLDDDSEPRINPRNCRDLHDLYIRVVVAACKWSMKPVPPSVGDLMIACKLETLLAITRKTSHKKMPKQLRDNVVDYLRCLPSYDAEEDNQPIELVEEHAMFLVPFFAALNAFEEEESMAMRAPYSSVPMHPDELVNALWTELHYRDGRDSEMWSARGRQFSEALVGACRWVVQPGTLHLSDLEEAAVLESFMLLADPDAYRNIPRQARQDVRRYLVSLPGYVEGSWHQLDTTIAQHNMVLDGFFPSLKRVQDKKQKDIEKVRSGSSPFLRGPSIFDGFSDERLAKIGVPLHAAIQSSHFSGGETLRAGRLVGILLSGMRQLHSDGNLDIEDCKRILDLDNLIALERSSTDEKLVELIGIYLNALPRDPKDRGSRDTNVLSVEHTQAVILVLMALGRRRFSQFIRH